jgi:YD repeat-containing protein
MHITRTVKNDVTRWNLGQPDTQTECSTAAGKTSCRTIERATNTFGEVDSETTSSNDGIDDTKLTVTYDQRDKFGNVTHLFAVDAVGNRREATTVYDDDGVYPIAHINALGHKTTNEYDKVLGVLKKVTDPNGLVTEFGHDGFARLTLEKHPDGSSTTITRTREKVGGVWRTKERVTTTGGADDERIIDSRGRTAVGSSFGKMTRLRLDSWGVWGAKQSARLFAQQKD